MLLRGTQRQEHNRVAGNPLRKGGPTQFGKLNGFRHDERIPLVLKNDLVLKKHPAQALFSAWPPRHPHSGTAR